MGRLQERSYDAWGRMRNPSTQSVYAPGSEPSLYLGRGYTGHEYLKEFGLVNMNARLYDPALGRFLSPDPLVQDSESSQNYNRYTYCLNNPLIHVDKDGEFFLTSVLVGALIGAAISAASYSVGTAVTGSSWRFSSFMKSVGIGAFSGAIGGAFSAAGRIAGLTKIANSFGYNLMGQVSSSITTDVVFGNNISFENVAATVVGAAIGTVIPTFKGLKTNAWVNTAAETGYNTIRGAATGLGQGLTKLAFGGSGKDLLRSIAGGAISGFSRTVGVNAIMGAPYRADANLSKGGIFRKGGIADILMGYGSGVTLGRNMYVEEGVPLTSLHENYHLLQQDILGYSYFYGRWAKEVFTQGFYLTYKTEGSLEYITTRFRPAKELLP